ncbi:hypothetical protein ACFQS7_30655 [Dankookia sp. GCM10030260]|uniref:hypothetical protein n=1 Tax=Dankookia sp. GCM10030260 TaxID=3273390 RepID=UPI00360B63AC
MSKPLVYGPGMVCDSEEAAKYQCLLSKAGCLSYCAGRGDLEHLHTDFKVHDEHFVMLAPITVQASTIFATLTRNR